ncbi:hypothetical protein EUGRSUZ_E03408 [Eucalyptus grandis]|uniref:Uncharacterized protein n=2 Tax=Eucalyptus grandis TaxID=71139 RepID=A0ACC3KZU9_EUCGR|nr:hypothetical protein EUGRSUZ_E03408 [Eucalyptus grandis]
MAGGLDLHRRKGHGRSQTGRRRATAMESGEEGGEDGGDTLEAGGSELRMAAADGVSGGLREYFEKKERGRGRCRVHLLFASADEQPATSTSAMTTSSDMSGKVHECSTCHKSFLTSQALDGHKWCHYEALTPASLTAATASTTNGPRHCKFDMNMLALPKFSPHFAVSSNVDDEVETPHLSKKPRFLMLMKTEAA